MFTRSTAVFPTTWFTKWFAEGGSSPLRNDAASRGLEPDEARHTLANGHHDEAH